MSKRTYLDLRCDVTDLDEQERSNLAGYLVAQTETCDGDGDDASGYPGVEYELDWVEVEDERTILVHVNIAVPATDKREAGEIARLIEGALEVGVEGAPDAGDLKVEIAMAEEV